MADKTAPTKNEIADLVRKIDKHIEAEFNPDWAERAANLMEQAVGLLDRFKDRKPVAYLGTAKVGKANRMLAYPNSPRSDEYTWTPLYE